MEKASRAIRRSGVKLLSLPGGHGDLNMLLSEIKDIRHSAKLLMNAQHLASQDMMKWAANEENRAIQDVISQVAELNLLWTEVQKLFIDHLKEYRHMFEQVLEGEKRVTEARTNLNYCEEKETKVKKEFKRVSKRATTTELRIFESKVSVAEKAKEMAQLELTERLQENEAIKLIQMKSGMMKISEAYIEMSNKCNILFTAQKNVVHQLPDVHTQELENIKYTGEGTTRMIVQHAREKLEKYNTGTSQDPPPPYTPPEPGSNVSRASGNAPQPAPRRAGARDSSPGPVSDLNINSNLSDQPASEHKIVHTHKVRIKMADSSDPDGIQSQKPPDEGVTHEDGKAVECDRIAATKDDDYDGGDDDDARTHTSLYPKLSKDTTESSQTEKEFQERPVPAPRPRLSNSSDVGKDGEDKTESKDTVNTDLVTEYTEDHKYVTGTMKDSNCVTESVKDSHCLTESVKDSHYVTESMKDSDSEELTSKTEQETEGVFDNATNTIP